MKKILLIEDEANLQKTMSEALRRAGYESINALDGEIGLNLAKNKKPDLILLDLVLPRLHGLEVLKKIKEDEETKAIPVIILTNLENMEDVDKAIALGATTYLVKTRYTLEEVTGKVKKALGE